MSHGYGPAADKREMVALITEPLTLPVAELACEGKASTGAVLHPRVKCPFLPRVRIHRVREDLLQRPGGFSRLRSERAWPGRSVPRWLTVVPQSVPQCAMIACCVNFLGQALLDPVAQLVEQRTFNELGRVRRVPRESASLP